MDKTHFYPESGGQESDEGMLTFANGVKFRVTNVQHIQGHSFHVGKLIVDDVNTTIKVNDMVQMEVDAKKRYDTTMNHTAVHLLNHAIR